ncbi:MAG: hypothetical protein KBT48_03850, partial [Firmicutes bacterium]|nr:hypothetical protein [Bacillota bacterium]
LHTQVCDMPKALTLNENLKAYGYTLRPQDIYALASSPSLDFFFENFVSLIPKVKAKPMYPDFPIEIMEMEEATFRFHQLLHYFSTYGIELLTGQEAQKGWLPEKEEIEKTKEDETLLTCKVIELIKASEMYSVLFKKIVSKKERLSITEKEMLEDVVKSMNPDTLSQTSIPFKENLMPIVYSIVKERKAVVPVLCELFQHTGDVLKCFDYFLVRNRYKVSKEEQCLFIQVLESYSIADFMNNVILSNRKANHTKVLLNYLNYNRYSKSPAHKEVVRALRNDELSSWYEKEDTMIFRWLVSNNLDVEKETLSFIGNRPGDMFRQLNYLYKLRFSTNSLFEEMGKHIASLSLETLVSTYSIFDSNAEVRELMHHILQEKMKTMHTPFQNKKVYMKNHEFVTIHQYSTIKRTLDENSS